MKKKCVIILMILIFRTSIINCYGQDETKIQNLPAFEISLGVSLAKPDLIIRRKEGIGSMISQYAAKLEHTLSTQGDFKENTLIFPGQILFHFLRKNNWFFTLGLEMAIGTNNSQKEYQLISQNQTTEKHTYQLQYHFLHLMPSIGLGLEISPFALYSRAGLLYTRFSHTYIFDYQEKNYSHQIENKMNVTNFGLGWIAGCQYRINLSGFNPLLLKLEISYLKNGQLKGQKIMTWSNSEGDGDTATEDGSVYAYDFKYIDQEPIPYWDMFPTQPTNSNYVNIQPLGLSYFSLRLLISYTF